MANNTVTLTFKVNSDGKLEQVTKQADKAAAATNRAGTAADKYSKKQKGVAQAGMNSTKAFSKMSNQLDGGGGLVAAYAGLAANIFALTAGFGALSRAAQATQLEKGLVEMGKASGLAMHTLSNGLVQATGHAISLEEAMRSVALITSAGIDASRIEEFGAVARKASVALGRDLQDSMNRLTRGVTKLEPELLDELGIMVRLDEATEKYAQSIGKSASDLSNFEKRQAFLNATLEEGEKKFGALGDVDVNPFDKLSASLQNLAKSGLGGLANLISPIVKFLSEKPVALTSVLILFASTISSQVLGSLASMTQKTKDQARATADLNRKKLTDISHMNRSSQTMKDVIRSMKDGKVSTQEYDKAIKGQQRSQATNLGLLNKRINQEKALGVQGKTLSDTNKRLGISQRDYNQRVKVSNKIITRLNIAQSQGRQSAAQLAAAKAQAAIAEGRFGVALKNVKRALLLQTASLKIASRSLGTFAGAANFASVALKGLAMAAKTAGAALMRMLGIIGMVVMAVQMVIDAFKFLVELFKSDEQKKYEEKTKALSEAQKELAGNLEEVDRGMAGQSDKINTLTAAYTAMNNILPTFLSKYKELDAAGMANNASYDEQVDALNNLISSSKHLRDEMQKQFGATTISGVATDRSKQSMIAAKDEVLRFIEVQNANAASVRAVGEAFKASKESVTEFLGSLKVTTSVDDIVSSTKDLFKTLETLPAHLNIGQFIQEGLSTNQAILFDVENEKRALEHIGKLRTNQINLIAGMEKTLQKSRKGQQALTTAGDANKNHRKERKARAALLGQIDIQKGILADITGEHDKIGALVNRQVGDAKKVFEQEQKAQIENKLLISSKKSLLEVEKARNINTIKALQTQIQAEDSLRSARIKSVKDQMKFVGQLRAGLELKAKEGELTDDQKLALAGFNAQYNDLVSQLKLLNVGQEKQLKTLTDVVRYRKMSVTMLQEEQMVAKAVLDISKKQASADKKSADIAVKLAKLEQRAANRQLGLAGKLLPSQVAAIELDGKVLLKKMSFLRLEATNKISAINLEREMLKAKLQVLKAEIDVINKKREDTGAKLIPTDELQQVMKDLGGSNNVFEQQIQNVNDELRLSLELLKEQVQTTDVQALKDMERLKIVLDQKQAVLDTKSAQSGLTKELQKQADLGIKLGKITNTDAGTGKAFNAIKSAQLEETARKNKIEAAQIEFDMMKARIEAEHALLDAKFALLKAEMAKDGQIDKNEAAVLSALSAANAQAKNLNEARLATAGKELEVVRAQADLDSKTAKFDAAKQGGLAGVMAAITGSATARKSDIDVKGAQKHKGIEVKPGATMDKSKDPVVVAVDKMVSELKNNKHLASIDTSVAHMAGFKPGSMSGTDSESSSTTTSTGGTAVDESGGVPTVGGPEQKAAAEEYKLTLTDVRAVTQGLATDLAALGPEGEVQAMFVEGLGTIMSGLDGYLTQMVTINEMEEGKAATQAKNIAIAQASAAAMAGINQMVQASAQKKVASIDKEIAAEQKRDGQSAASVAKLQALQKKKEATERKAFEKGKKLKMAMTVANTAASIMTALAEPPLGLGPVAGIPLAAMMGVTGALQLAAIASTSYEGGGGSAPKGPSSIKVGQRSNTVDLAKGRNAGSELAYTRGADGMGSGMTNYKTAFTGYKHRAAGGYIVGEQGPELFMPDVPGSILPADETEEMQDTAPINVNFTIQAIDSQNMESALITQRANIIGMIREAAHDNGDEFLESVDLTETSY